MLLAAWLHIVSAVIFVGLAVFLMFIILLQRGKGVGLAGAFGGTGGQTVFGSKTGDVLTLATVIFASIFLFFTIILNLWVFQPVRSDFGPTQTIGSLGGAPLESASDAPAPADSMPIEIPMPSELPVEPAADEPGADAPAGDAPAADESASITGETPVPHPPVDQNR